MSYRSVRANWRILNSADSGRTSWSRCAWFCLCVPAQDLVFVRSATVSWIQSTAIYPRFLIVYILPWIMLPYDFNKFALIPFGGSIVIFDPFCKTETGKAMEGIEVSQILKMNFSKIDDYNNIRIFQDITKPGHTFQLFRILCSSR